MRKGDFIGGAAIALLGLFVILYSYSLTTPKSSGIIDAAFLPKFIGIVLFITGSLLFIKAFRKSRYLQESSIVLHIKEIVMIIAFIIYVFLIPYFGFVILTPLFIISLAFYLGFKNIFANISISILVTAGIYILFNQVLNIPMPTGILI